MTDSCRYCNRINNLFVVRHNESLLLTAFVFLLCRKQKPTMTTMMMTRWFLPLFLLLTFLSLLTNSNGCLVLDAHQVDITSSVLDDSESQEIPTVTCTDQGANRNICHSSLIQNCPKVQCQGQEACANATITNFTHEVICDGLHACHLTQMVAASERVEFARNVVCQGGGACNVAIIDSNNAQAMNVLCLGSKACRKAEITSGEGTVRCTAGSSRYQACEGSTRITAKCLICQENGCDSRAINKCKYQTSANAPFVKCEETVGACEESITTAQQEEQDELAGGKQDDADGE
jgi:hypothetical protein